MKAPVELTDIEDGILYCMFRQSFLGSNFVPSYFFYVGQKRGRSRVRIVAKVFGTGMIPMFEWTNSTYLEVNLDERIYQLNTSDLASLLGNFSENFKAGEWVARMMRENLTEAEKDNLLGIGISKKFFN